MGISIKRLSVGHSEGGCACCSRSAVIKVWLGMANATQSFLLCEDHTRELLVTMSNMTK